MNTGSQAGLTAPSAVELEDKPPVRNSIFGVLARGGTALGISTVLERGLGFLANLLAARLAGPQIFGAYTLVLTTANTVSSYAGMGIGATATRFSARHLPNSVGYRNLLRSLFCVSALSASLGCAVMLVAAGPLSHFALHNPALAPMLRLAAVTVGAAIALECCRGLLLGQQQFRGLLFLSATSGTALAILVPLAARRSAFSMVGGQAIALSLAALIGAIFASRIRPVHIPAASVDTSVAKTSIAAVVRFGAVQFSALMGISLSGWWIASLVARSDSSLKQMGLYAVASQMRNLASTLPGILGQVGFPLLTEEKSLDYGGPKRVLAVNSFIASTLALGIGGLAIIALPFMLTLLFSRSYAGADIAAVLALATAIIHMSSGPAASRLLIVSLRSIGFINVIWASLCIALSSWLVPVAGAAGAFGTLLLAHLVSSALVLRGLKRRRESPPGLLVLSIGTSGGVLVLATLGVIGALPSHKHFAVLELTLLTAFFMALTYLGHIRGWIPRRLYETRIVLNLLALLCRK